MSMDGEHRYSCSCSCIPLVIGSALAVGMSWAFNHSVLWCILHGILGWLYVGYKATWYVVTNQ